MKAMTICLVLLFLTVGQQDRPRWAQNATVTNSMLEIFVSSCGPEFLLVSTVIAPMLVENPNWRKDESLEISCSILRGKDDFRTAEMRKLDVVQFSSIKHEGQRIVFICDFTPAEFNSRAVVTVKSKGEIKRVSVYTLVSNNNNNDGVRWQLLKTATKEGTGTLLHGRKRGKKREQEKAEQEKVPGAKK